jgi:hypothetical protein
MSARRSTVWTGSLNAYVPKLQVAGQVVRFATEHLAMPVPSPVVFARRGDRFRGEEGLRGAASDA